MTQRGILTICNASIREDVMGFIWKVFRFRVARYLVCGWGVTCHGRSIVLCSMLLIGWLYLSHSLAAQDSSPASEIGNTGKATNLEPIGKVVKVHGGFSFTEGPAYDKKGFLYFTDIPNDRILRTDLNGNLEVFLQPSGHCNGLFVDGAGRLLACRMDGELISIDTASKSVQPLATQHEGIRFNACNDLVVDKSGGVYFTDPRYRAPEPWPQGKEAFYYRTPLGEVTRLGDDLVAPNGIMLSPDEKTLYVLPSMQSNLYAYRIVSPGKLGEKSVLYVIKQPANQSGTGGDGMTVDVSGNLYLTTHIGIQIVSSKGELLRVIEFPEQPANCAFGGPENKTLFATCRTGLYSIDMPVAGHRFPGVVP